MEKLGDALFVVESFVSSLEAELIDLAQATELVEMFEKGARLCSTGRALAARRVAECNAWKAEGFRNPADWLAAKTKTSSAQANEELQTAEQIRSLPATREALVTGEITLEQAAAVASAAAVDPASERRLLEEADRSSLRDLQRQAHATRTAASADQASQREQIHQSRYLRTWTTKDGAYEGRFRLTPDHGAIVAAALDVEHTRVFAAARADGRYEPAQAYAADALVNLARNTSDARPERLPGPGPRAVVNIRVDYTALRRGFTEPGEVCEITNGGPVSVELARHAAEDAFIRLHLYDEERLIDVANPGRNVTAAMRHGLEQRDRTCCVPGCDATRHLEIHHLRGVTLGGKASLDNLARVCSRHHDQISNQGACLSGTPGNWTWRPPTKPPIEPRTRVRTASGGSCGQQDAGVQLATGHWER